MLAVYGDFSLISAMLCELLLIGSLCLHERLIYPNKKVRETELCLMDRDPLTLSEKLQRDVVRRRSLDAHRTTAAGTSCLLHHSLGWKGKCGPI